MYLIPPYSHIQGQLMLNSTRHISSPSLLPSLPIILLPSVMHLAVHMTVMIM